MNRKTEELQQALAAREAAGGKQDKLPGIPTADDLKGLSFEEFEQEFPEVAQFVKAQVAAATTPIQQQLAPVQQLVSERQQAAQEQVIQQELGRLAQVHPDFKEVAVSPDFDAWVSTQPPMIQQLRSSFSADDNAALITLFKTSTGRMTATASHQAQPTNSLADHVTTERKGTGTPTAVRRTDDNFADAFNFHVTHR
ncbi:MAG: hypothetical protein U5L02_06415 [Rheinheimera sp.]|nr:hypothetical protein [Rheinheimera sp.]